MDKGSDVWPRGFDAPASCGKGSLEVNVWIFVVELFNNLLIEAAEEAHEEDRGKFPQVIATRVSGTDGILVPLQGSTYGCLKDSPSDFLGNVRVPVELVKRLLNSLESPFRNRGITCIVKAFGVGILQNRPQRNRRSGPHLFGFLAVP